MDAGGGMGLMAERIAKGRKREGSGGWVSVVPPRTGGLDLT